MAKEAATNLSGKLWWLNFGSLSFAAKNFWHNISSKYMLQQLSSKNCRLINFSGWCGGGGG